MSNDYRDEIQVEIIECSYLRQCTFVNEFDDTELTGVINELKRIYCRGPFAGDCLRRRHVEKEGQMPAANYSPTGVRY